MSPRWLIAFTAVAMAPGTGTSIVVNSSANAGLKAALPHRESAKNAGAVPRRQLIGASLIPQDGDIHFRVHAGQHVTTVDGAERDFFVAVAHRKTRRPDAESTPERPTFATFFVFGSSPI